ncbi:DUF4260 family protein [Mesorhizobium sp. M1C.F.Ca.ET.193.01.1.1]|uniref:DUF4260 domain-containing protein n=2 Tax=Mesorhizobium TaxID=68287 RepID=UPI000FD2ADE4|nr:MULTISPECIES: DUF4260 domain-containing protein [unclassified Mesorhizobium]TGT04136.1 DUF4260 family protein [bacterium M00.F.Ca.ET.177.01.1.1]TGQ56727.1 DUF4260 family protein [Mesorhizobium sp. M1C.F.Ca.ET.210.01.1.1]TGQ75494.1 DUF4260 family protein [Mesorhizobium sp. M1C.F.Ca.ET.212.01.1.1]TGR13903.1 DUF4260 family protein [Mesorhizobium sp. M1C.F.Ca.ET.204.01.1.1]TGR34158.1 DUF4260 family protein [Mesorhizobium sp. M1C.F.Ca.ET.196.01.1.1]
MRSVDLTIRLEWVAAAVAAIILYKMTGVSWWLFALLILAPDLSMLGYLAGPRIGAVTYNALHILVAPLVLALAGVLFGAPITTAVALIWIAHIAIDRALGYGLKLPTGFQETHLGRIGRDRRGAAG